MPPRTVLRPTIRPRPYRGLGDRLNALRTAADLTQSQAAATLGVSRQFLSAVEIGICRPSPTHLAALAALYAAPLDDLRILARLAPLPRS